MTLQQYKNKISKDPRFKKLNFEPDGRTHEVYRISHLLDNKHYYGSKSNNFILGESYISSSRDTNFIKEQKEHPERFKYKIIKTYDNPSDKIIHEAYLHQRFNVKLHASFYNKSNQTPFGFDTTGKNFPMSEERKTKLLGEGNPFFGRTHSKETKEKLRKINSGKLLDETQKEKMRGKRFNYHSENFKEKMSKLHKNKIITEETRKKMSNKKKVRYMLYDKNSSLMYDFRDKFLKFCKEHDLPANALLESYRKNGEPIFQTKNAKTLCSKNGQSKFIGWRCFKVKCVD